MVGASMLIRSSEQLCPNSLDASPTSHVHSTLSGIVGWCSGDIFVFGHSTSRASRQVYRMMGICPQHDVLWPNCTVREHLELYATLKGVEPESVEGEARRTMEAFDLVEKGELSCSTPIQL